jgi:hypothetical protein
VEHGALPFWLVAQIVNFAQAYCSEGAQGILAFQSALESSAKSSPAPNVIAVAP